MYGKATHHILVLLQDIIRSVRHLRDTWTVHKSSSVRGFLAALRLEVGQIRR